MLDSKHKTEEDEKADVIYSLLASVNLADVRLNLVAESNHPNDVDEPSILNVVQPLVREQVKKVQNAPLRI